MSREDHPVWSVYDRLRSARLSVKYYSWKLQQAEKLNFWLEVILLVAAPSSAVASLWFLEYEYGQIFWKCLAISAAIAAVVKPQLHLTKKIKDYEGGAFRLSHSGVRLDGNKNWDRTKEKIRCTTSSVFQKGSAKRGVVAQIAKSLILKEILFA